MNTNTGIGSAPTTTVTPRATPRSERLFTPSFVSLGLADMAYFLAVGVAVYALPLYVTGPIGSTAGGAGLAFGAFAVSAILLRPLAGRWSDTHGRRPLLVGGALLAAVALLATPLADTLAAVVALRLVLGVAEALFFVASLAALADLAPPGRTAEAISYNSLGLYLGLALGAPLGEGLVTVLGFAGAWSAAAVLALAAAILAGRIGETRAPRPPAAPPAALIHLPAVPAALGFLASIIAMGSFLAFVSLHANSIGMASASLPLFIYGIVVVVLRIALAPIQNKLPPLKTAAAALLTITAGLLVLLGWATPTGLLTGAVLLGTGVALSTPAFFAAIFATADPSSRGAAAGTFSIALDLGLGAGPIILGWVAYSSSIATAFLVAAAVVLAGSAWTILLTRARPAAADKHT